MRHWEKTEKDVRRTADREILPHQQDHKKKKLKPAEKTKYRAKGYELEEE